MNANLDSPQTQPDLIRIVHADAAILVLNKPAGLVCHPTKQDLRSSLVGRLRLHLGATTRFHLVNRLDRETSGLIVIALDDDTARLLRRAWEQREVTKEYWAIVHGHPVANDFSIDAPLGRDESSPIAIRDWIRPDGAPAQTEFHVLNRFERSGRPFSLLQVRPQTGRKHQIRIHCASAGHAIVGDKIYGHDPAAYLDFVKGRLTPEQRASLLLENHALHARSIRWTWRGREESFQVAPEPDFSEFSGQNSASLKV